MSTPSERLEATEWLETTVPNAPREVRKNFLAGVDAYYAEHPTADRGSDFLTTLREDNEAFALILRAVLAEDHLLAETADVVLNVPPQSR